MDEQRARAEYQSGVELAAQKKWKEAEEKFAQVASFRSAPPVLLALGRAQIENGKLATAKTTLERAANDSDPSYAEVVGQARETLRALDPRVPRIELVLPSGVDSTEVTVDGTRADAAVGIAVNPGVAHRVVVKAPGRNPFQSDLTLSEGEHRKLEVVFRAEAAAAPKAAPAPAPEAAPEPAGGGRSVVGPLVLGGAGVVAGVVGIVVRLGGQSTYDDAAARCTPGCPEAAVQEGNDARSTMLTGTIVAGVGLAAIAGAGVWWALSGSSDQGSAGLRVGVAGGPSGPIAVVRGSL